jgi:hypothetical protein
MFDCSFHGCRTLSVLRFLCSLFADDRLFLLMLRR